MDKEATAIGIDVGKHKLDVALIIEGKVRSKSVANSSAGYQELTAWLTRQNVELDTCLVCMESTGVYSEPVALGLQALGLTVSLVNPARIKGYGQSELVRNKNDGIDAALIARYCAKMHPQPWKEPTPAHLRYIYSRSYVDVSNGEPSNSKRTLYAGSRRQSPQPCAQELCRASSC